MPFSVNQHVCMTLGVACLMALVPGSVAQWNDEEAQKDCVSKNECGASFPIVPPCTCSDIPPVYYAGGPLNATCVQVVERDACNNPGLQNVSQSEITGGYCQRSCGRCNCCSTFQALLRNNSFNTFLQAATAAGLGANLSSPAYSFTLLAPSDAAFTAYLARAGLTMPRLLANRALLQHIVTYHLLPNVPVIDAFWTTPFLLPGTVLSTLLGPRAAIRVTPGAGLTFNGIAQATTRDILTCKGNIIGIDTVLTPPSAVVARSPPLWDPSPAATAAANYTTLATPPGVEARTIAAPQVYLPNEPKQAAPVVPAPIVANSNGQEP